MASSQKLLLVTHLLIIAAGVALLQATPSSADWRVFVNITNSLETKENLQVHCKDKHSDFGVRQVPAGAQYVFGFNPTFTADYFCGFYFQNTLHWFDIYLDKRDWIECGASGLCNWFVKVGGPCYGDLTSDCFPWN